MAARQREVFFEKQMAKKFKKNWRGFWGRAVGGFFCLLLLIAKTNHVELDALGAICDDLFDAELNF